MELQKNKELFVKNLKDFLNSVVLNNEFWSELEKHQKSIYIDSVKVREICGIILKLSEIYIFSLTK
jgi:hypothetical protein